eukprot:TRINITY_DN1748_c0_g1_i1.p1 TRINITY_DN1748_c0_g1~~TRINITY_DN1748_c0_g1_i1.p1  ORF type:complete len:1062 (-),score=285.77 TRINITY_DN1748_c0_g1_i1:27-3212(-)
MSITTAQQMQEVLLRMLDPATAKQATDILNKQLKQSSSIPILLDLIQVTTSPDIRQLALVLLRKKILGHWGKLKPDVQERFKSILLDILVKEPNPPVRKATGEAVAYVARILLPIGQWKELLDFLLKCSQSPQPEHRESAMVLFDSLTANLGENMREHFPLLLQIFMKGLADPESKVRIASLKALGGLVQWLSTDQEVRMFKDLLPPMIAVIRFCLKEGYDDEAISAFEVFDDLVEIPMPVVSLCIPDLIKFVLEVGGDKSIDMNVRQRALTLVEWTATFKPKALIKNNLIAPILQVVFPMCAEPSEDDDDDDEEFRNPHRFASQLIDGMGLHIPSKHIFGPAMEYIGQYISSADPNYRKAAVVALAVLSEGCSLEMRNPPEKLTKLLEYIYACFQDPDQGVREAACVALGQFSTHLQPDICLHYKTVLPLLFQALNDPTHKVRRGCCYALESFCQHLGEEIAPYLEPLMNRLVELLQKGNLEIQEIALSAISSTAAAAKKAFMPFYGPLINMMKHLISSGHQEDTIFLRCRAIECVGLLAHAVGKEIFSPVLREFMTLALNLCALDIPEFREFAYGFFANIAETFNEEFAEFLPVIMPILLASCDSSEGLNVTNEAEVEGGDGIEGDEDEEDDENGSFTVRTAYMDEKASACRAIGIIAEHTKANFVPYMERVMQSFSLLFNYFHEAVRQEVLQALPPLLVAVHAAFPVQSFVPENSANQTQSVNIHENTKKLLAAILPTILHRIELDDDKETVCVAFEMVDKILNLLGPNAATPHIEYIMKCVHLVLSKQANCQAHEEEDEGEDEGMDIALIESACDTIVALAKTFGPFFDTYFQAIVPHVIKYYQQKSEGETYRSLAVGTLADIIKNMGNVTAKYIEQLFPITMKATADPDPEVRSNATFLLGILLANCGAQGVPYYGQALLALSKLFNDSALPNIVDNACGAVCRMIMTNPNAVPLNQVLPVLLSALPLKADMEENSTVYNCLFHLFNTSNPVLASNLGASVSAFARALGSPKIEQDLHIKIVDTLKNLAQSNGAVFEQIVKSLPPQEVQNLQKVMS